MTILIAAVILVGALCLLDLLLTFGVIRRLREHTTHLEGLLNTVGMGDAQRILGKPVGDFAATTTDGEPVSRALLSGETVVAFFSPTCGPCKEKAPVFADLVRAHALDRQQVLAVVAGDGGEEESARMAGLLEPSARVVMDRGGEDSVAGAFQISAFPTFCLVDAEGVVRVVDSDADRLLVPADA
ncbi:TlpA disulfide reductase family protein [Nonomuraea sp. NPDC048826]|uniref:TlpA disulfide reductase family protein n=1 Tax=Nonomuraea sp. NPDC048826 TaxID=3364347 RepID=UPI0037160CB6